jgi:hypothetical protein
VVRPDQVNRAITVGRTPTSAEIKMISRIVPKVMAGS